MPNIAVVSFASGEISPQTDARKDIEKYTGGCRKLENMIPDIYGNATKRPGTELITVGNGSACYYLPVTPDPAKIQIYTAQDLQDMQNNLSGDYELMNAIDLADFDYTAVGGTLGNPFTGTLDGNRYVISNLSITTTTNRQGLFAVTDEATIENLIMEDVDIHGRNQLGAIVGIAIDTHIEQCGSTGDIYFDQLVVAGAYGGGIAGEMYHTGTARRLWRCWSTVDIHHGYGLGHDNGLGGLIGNCFALVQDCWAGGSMISHHASPTWWSNHTGGALGIDTEQTTKRCYSYGFVQTSPDDGENRIGGFLGRIGSTNTDNHWDITTSEMDKGGQGSDIDGIDGHITSVMYQQATYENWDFDTIWNIDEGEGYPTLRWMRDANIKAVCYPL